ncbi:hypothetical protein ES708_16706 [subsurface metagenome]
MTTDRPITLKYICTSRIKVPDEIVVPIMEGSFLNEAMRVLQDSQHASVAYR